MRQFDALELVLLLVDGIWVMLPIALGAWIIAVFGGLGLALALRAESRILHGAIDFICVALRGTPELLMIYILFYGTSTGLRLGGIEAVAIALGLIYAAFAAEIFKASFATVPASQRRAAESLGLSGRQIQQLVILPQAARFALIPLANVFFALMKLASYAAAVGVAEIVYQGRNYMVETGAVVPVAIGIAALYLAITLPFTKALRNLETKLHRGRVLVRT